MGTDPGLLKNGLKNYSESLAYHQRELQEDFRDLSQHFALVNQAYEGVAAEAFKNSWMATAHWFEDYIDQTTLLIALLEERISALELDK